MSLFEKQIIEFLSRDISITKDILNSDECSSEIIREIINNPIIKRGLYTDDYYDLEVMIADHVNSTSEILYKLSRKHDNYLKECVAANPNTDNITLMKLSGCKDDSVRHQVAQNENSNNKILKRLSKDKETDIRESVVENPRCSTGILAALSNDHSDWVRRAVALHEKCNLRTLKKLAFNDGCLGSSEYSQDVRCNALEHPKYNNDMLLRAAKTEGNKYVQFGIVKRANSKILHVLAGRTTFPTVKLGIVAQPMCSSDTLDMLYKEGKAKHNIRNAIANHSSCSVVTLMRCANDKAASIRNLVLKHPNTTAEIIRTIWDRDHARSYDMCTISCYRLAKHINTPEDILHKLSFRSKYYDEEDHIDTANHLAGNPNTTLKTLQKLYGFKHCKENPQFIKEITNHPNCPIAASFDNDDFNQVMEKYF